jgi:RNA polymerase sigma factor (sigma-70 family)
MAAAHMEALVRRLRRAVLRQDGAGWTDGQLLASFINQKDEAAFEALVHRHGPMVFGVCRRVIGHHHDAEDAFQATFLVLARKASSVRPRERVANWLHGVALRTAMKAKAVRAKRRGREKQLTAMPEPEAAQQGQWCDLQPLLDQELNGLPENYRLPILLCDLEGQTIVASGKGAARQLGWPQGTVAGRLARGRKLLAKRLANRGVVLPAGSLAAVLSQNPASADVPTSLMGCTVKAATLVAAGQATVAGVVPAKVATLSEGVLKAMLWSKVRTSTVGSALAILLIGAVGAVCQTHAGQQPKEEQKPKPAVEEDIEDQKKGQIPRNTLAGVWAVVSVKDKGDNTLDRDPIFVHFAGTEAPIRNARLTLQGEKFTLKTGPVCLEGNYGFEPSVPPKKIFLTVSESGQVASIEGVYSLDGDQLTITFGSLPASLVASLAGKEPGVCYTLRREPLPKKDADSPK